MMRWFLRSMVRPIFWQGDVHAWRRRWRHERRPRGMYVQSVVCNGVPAEWTIAPNSGRHVIYYLHGGGFVMGSPATHRALIAKMCRAAGARALAIDYRLAPEHPFPAALEDCLAGYRWLVADGVRPEDILVAGDSAGGCLALAMLVALRDAGDALPAGAVCLSPATDLTLNGASFVTRLADEAILTPAFVASVDRHYRRGQDARNPLASPLFADLRGLPPLLLHVGTHELLLDDSLRFADIASAAGVDVTLKVWDGLWHVFHTFVSLPESRQAIDEIGHFARQRFAAPTRTP